jgi:hypothetical protein
MSRGGISCAKYVLLIGMLAGAALFHVWQKVEMARVAGGINTAETQIVELDRERTQLLAAISVRKNSGFVEKVALGQLGMIYPSKTVDSMGGALAHWEGD